MKPIRPALLALSILVCPPAIAGDVAGELSFEITALELADHVRILADDGMEGRRAGTPGGERAAAYIVRQFEAAGLEPAGDEGAYLQWFGLKGRVPVVETCSLRVLPARGEPAEFSVGRDWAPFSFSREGEIAGAEVVFAGYGIRAPGAGYDDYAGIDVEGKVVVLLRRGPGGAHVDPIGRARQTFEQKARIAEARGAVAVLQVDDRLHKPAQADRVPTRIPVRGKAPAVLYVFAKRRVTDALFDAAGLDLGELEREIDRTGKPASRPLAGVTLDLSLALRASRAPNVVGLLPGSDPKLEGEEVVVGAHYDHLGTDGMGALDAGSKDPIWNGADDNASGTAGLIEIAEQLALSGEPPRRTVVFVAFTGEELGLLGSGHYGKEPAVALDRTVAMLNLDMIGRSRNDYVLVGGTGTCAPFDRILTEAAAGSGLSIRRRPDGGAPSDQRVFDGKEIPTLFFFSGLHKDYHRVTDDWEKLNVPGAAKISRLAARILRAVADLPERPAYVQVKRRRVQLGITLARNDAGPGALIESVMQASPAAGAGLIDGDRILSFAGAAVPDGAALVAAIRGCRPGQQVEIVVRRGEKTLTLEVKLGGR